jgi:hypothetical protein
VEISVSLSMITKCHLKTSDLGSLVFYLKLRNDRFAQAVLEKSRGGCFDAPLKTHQMGLSGNY